MCGLPTTKGDGISDTLTPAPSAHGTPRTRVGGPNGSTQFLPGVFAMCCRSSIIIHGFFIEWMIERTNRTVKDALAALVRRSPSQWPLYLPAVRFALNSAIHRSVSEQPLYLLTGRMAFFPRGLTNAQVVDEELTVQRLTDARRLAVEVSQQCEQGVNESECSNGSRSQMCMPILSLCCSLYQNRHVRTDDFPCWGRSCSVPVRASNF
ncbi:uncharacterized protein LOC119571817 [Penaeus monodon]|uniref:uncharacterized protein LOC119571817 n=1 Tax=Penaeus monodon TaxID=6687 RepID=UPI0018A79DB2|nr:uncharacterized protein LOC119571817 [Penaeus monodon]